MEWIEVDEFLAHLDTADRIYVWSSTVDTFLPVSRVHVQKAFRTSEYAVRAKVNCCCVGTEEGELILYLE